MSLSKYISPSSVWMKAPKNAVMVRFFGDTPFFTCSGAVTKKDIMDVKRGRAKIIYHENDEVKP